MEPVVRRIRLSSCVVILFVVGALGWGRSLHAGASANQPAGRQQTVENQSTDCEWGVFNEGTMVVKFDDPAKKETCYGSPCNATFAVKEHGLEIPNPKSEQWHPYLIGRTSKGDRARLSFSVAKRWDVTWRAGESLRVRRVIGMTACTGGGSDNHETSTQSATEIRDRLGKLLLLSAPDVPLAPGGQALIAPGFGAEVTLSWTDLGCSAYQGPGIGTIGGGRRTVGIVVADARAGNRAVVTWGRSATVRLAGHTYVVAVNQGWVLANGLGCGRAALAIYRSDYLKEI
jgi:hypothetical protein